MNITASPNPLDASPESSRHTHPLALTCLPRLALQRVVVPHPTRSLSMSAESTALRAQLKAFEREFRAKHFRDPAVDDIKKAGYGNRLPPIAEVHTWLISRMRS